MNSTQNICKTYFTYFCCKESILIRICVLSARYLLEKHMFDILFGHKIENKECPNCFIYKGIYYICILHKIIIQSLINSFKNNKRHTRMYPSMGMFLNISKKKL